MSAPRPPRPPAPRPVARDTAADLNIDWDALPDDWRTREYRIRRRGETRREFANRIRAQAVSGLIGVAELDFADWIEGTVQP